MIHLTLAKVVTAARLAYDEGRLSAQGPTPECRYRDESGRPCVVGAAMTDEEARSLARDHNSMSISKIPSSLVTIPPDDRFGISMIQGAHDRWADCGTDKRLRLFASGVRFVRNLRIATLRNFIADLPPHRFNMGEYLSTDSGDFSDLARDCGTAACIAGWAIHLWATDKIATNPRACAQEILGLTDLQARNLFTPPGCEYDFRFTQEAAVRTLDHLLETDEVVWS